MVLLNHTSSGRVAMNPSGDGFYSDFYLGKGVYNNISLNRLNEFKNQRFYLNALTKMKFYQRSFTFNHTYEYVGVKTLTSSNLKRTSNIVNRE